MQAQRNSNTPSSTTDFLFFNFSNLRCLTSLWQTFWALLLSRGSRAFMSQLYCSGDDRHSYGCDCLWSFCYYWVCSVVYEDSDCYCFYYDPPLNVMVSCRFASLDGKALDFERRSAAAQHKQHGLACLVPATSEPIIAVAVTLAARRQPLKSTVPGYSELGRWRLEKPIRIINSIDAISIKNRIYNNNVSK